MANSILKHSFSITHIPYESKTDCALNIKKRRESIVFSGRTDIDNINLAYIQTEAINSNDNLFVSDHSTRLPANRIDNTDPVIFTGASTSLDVDTFLLTDVFTTETPTQPSVPLFYQHLIDRDKYNPDDANQAILSLEILDTDLSPILDLTEIKLTTTSFRDTNYGVLFNNLQNEFNSVANMPVVYYLKYTVKNGTTITNYVELLDNQSIYHEATFDDVDEFGTLLSSRKVYILEEATAGTFNITISSSQKYAIVQLLQSRIQILKPNLRSNEEPWYVSIANGKFFTTLQGHPVFKYAIAEFESQLFSPYYPFKLITRETAIGFGTNLFKLSRNNIVIDADQDFHLTVEIEDETGTVIKAFTTDINKIGTSFSPSIQYTDGIRSIDQFNGYIDLRNKLSAAHTVKVSYTYEEKEFEFTEVDFNPVNNSDADKETTVLYIVPQTTPLDMTLYYLRVDKNGNVIYSSEAEQGATPEATEIAARMVSSSGLSYGGGAGFLDSYTIETTGNIADVPGYLVLGEIYVGEAASPDDVRWIDIRRRGGGLKDVLGSREELLQSNMESTWNWDIGNWDGYPYPGAASYYVEVPCQLLTTNSGTFSKEQIRTSVEEHTAGGVYPAIRTYGPDPQFIVASGVTMPASGVVDLEWTDVGPNITYNVYQALAQDGPYEKITSVPLSTTFTTVSGLNSKVEYWFMVVGIKDDIECIESDGISKIGVETI
jgi:hypothetical protein